MWRCVDRYIGEGGREREREREGGDIVNRFPFYHHPSLIVGLHRAGCEGGEVLGGGGDGGGETDALWVETQVRE